MFTLKFTGRRRQPAVPEPLPPQERRKANLPPFGNVTGLELLALLMSR